ncbi:MAG: type II toxin-antitoxin system HicA family toxin [Candidatus Chisholmbacteria bacterium]|nr:type II toxin-antitoxin system HicA family toxin [Candidatus Chisholmbacteria bacterium]
MPKLPQIKPRKIQKVLTKQGFIPRTTKGSHVVFNHPDGRRTVVPVHNYPVRIGTLKAILNQAKISVPDFLKLL